MAIPDGTQALLMDENVDMASQMVSVIYQLGVRHIELTPICPSINIGIEEKTVIVLGETKYVSNISNKVIDIGGSLLDISTIMNIGAKLNLIHILQRQNIRKSYKEIVTTDAGLSTIIRQTNRFESEIDILLQVLDDGIIGITSKGIITNYNEGAENIIGYKKSDIIGKHGLHVLPDIPFKYVLENLEPVKEKLIRINGYDIVVSVDPIIHSNKLYGAVAIVKKFNDIEKKQHKLREQLIGKGHRAKYGFEDIQGESEAIKRCIDIARRMAKSESSILITGESGTGKELFAQAIHNNSKRRNYQFVAINCGALPESLLESELFGYTKGSFTGAKEEGKDGLFKIADKGTIFLDEIGELSLSLQAKLLRVLQEGTIRKIGSVLEEKINVRVIAATNRNLESMIKDGTFREDLYYRLNVIPIFIPPLRDRIEDIPMLVNFFINKLNKQLDKNIKGAETEFIEKLVKYQWPGNVRELRNVVERAMNLCYSNLLNEDNLILDFEKNTNYINEEKRDDFSFTLKEVVEIAEKKALLSAIKKHSSFRKAAKTLGISHTTIMNKIKKYNIECKE